MAPLLALVCDVNCDFVSFPFGILGQVWYSIVSIPDPHCLSYFHMNMLYNPYTQQSNLFTMYSLSRILFLEMSQHKLL